jgi:hypothetical protein
MYVESVLLLALLHTSGEPLCLDRYSHWTPSMLAGRASIQLTLDRYSHLMPSMSRNSAESMDEASG